MNICNPIPLLLALSLPLVAQDKDSPITNLRQAVENYVIAYNERDAEGLSELFTENGEIVSSDGEEITTGREALKSRFDEQFASDENATSIAIEVDSVRLVAPGIAIEDGTIHLTANEGDAAPSSLNYTAVLQKTEEGDWLIASTRVLEDISDPASNLAPLAAVLNGDWTARGEDGVRLDLAIGWDSGGKTISGEMLTTASDADPQVGGIRIVWNGVRKSIVSTIFDESGGTTIGIWTETEDGWLIHSEGFTGDGETTMKIQRLSKVDDGSLLWSVTNDVIDGESQPDRQIRLVRQAPAPSKD